jgi:hypothetical protein
MLENDESFSTKSLDNPETIDPIPVLSFNTNSEKKNNIEKCVQQQEQTIVEDDNVQHPTTVMRTLVTHYLRSTQQQNELRRTLLRVYVTQGYMGMGVPMKLKFTFLSNI